MKPYERSAFWRFFGVYFGSVGALILLAGHFYYHERYEALLGQMHFELIDYARAYKMGDASYHSTTVTHRQVDINRSIAIDNLSLKQTQIIKFIPHEEGYLRLQMNRDRFDTALGHLRMHIYLIQLFLLLLFGVLSAWLAHSAINPLRDTISRLDAFSKDLIHDLNTPITAILLNVTLLRSTPSNTRALERIETNAKRIMNLHENLATLLHERPFTNTTITPCPLIEELMATYRLLYPTLQFALTCKGIARPLNADALHQIISALLSNACRYNKEGGSVVIVYDGKELLVRDTGVGIAQSERVFERHFSEQGSSGLGLHIVKRLCDAMNISLTVTSKVDAGTTVRLTFN
ncbi:MAG: HAMP domain-containing histidine kinase [Campylobacterales bacterium]|nr:HAMP domain-containing histidine kinase [Campylobacterales bacterium]